MKLTSDSSSSEIVSTDTKKTASQIEQPADELPLNNWSEVDTRTFTRTSPRCRKSQLAAEALESQSGSNSSAASDAEERVRCNGGESMVDCAAEVLWPPDETTRDRSHRVSDSRLQDMVDIQIVAKAKLQENGQCRFVSFCRIYGFNVQFVLLYNSNNTSCSLADVLI